MYFGTRLSYSGATRVVRSTPPRSIPHKWSADAHTWLISHSSSDSSQKRNMIGRWIWSLTLFAASPSWLWLWLRSSSIASSKLYAITFDTFLYVMRDMLKLQASEQPPFCGRNKPKLLSDRGLVRLRFSDRRQDNAIFRVWWPGLYNPHILLTLRLDKACTTFDWSKALQISKLNSDTFLDGVESCRHFK